MAGRRSSPAGHPPFPMIPRLLRFAALGLVVGTSLALGSAAGLPLGAAGLGSGSVPVAGCLASGGPDVTYEADAAGAITAVIVDALPAACAGGRLSATLVGAAGPLDTSGPVTIIGTTATVPFAPTVASADVARSDLVIVGP
jgi:hypothetical protein